MFIKIGKKAKAFKIRKVTRQIKDETEAPKKQRHYEKLAEIKKLDHNDLGEYFLRRIISEHQQLCELVDRSPVEIPANMLASLETPAIKREVETEAIQLRDFIHKLYHSGKAELPEEQDNDIFVGLLSEKPRKRKAVPKVIEKPRKNRLGQRARRQMWELKYGSKANHVANTVFEGQKKERPERKIFADKKLTKSPVADHPFDLHPSWAAKIAQKQRMQELCGSAPQKIVFEESD